VVLRIAGLYQKFRRAYISDGYYALPKSGDPSASRNWQHFTRAAAFLQDNSASEKEWIAAQFVGATQAAYPRPNQLYSKAAAQKWKEYQGMIQDWDEAIREQQDYLRQFSHRWKLEEKLMVLMTHMFPFRPWFVAVTADTEDLTSDMVKDALDELRSIDLTRALADAGYAIQTIKCKLRNSLGDENEV